MTVSEHHLTRFVVNSLASILPAVSAQLSYRIWTRTFRYKRPPREQVCFESARKSFITSEKQKVAVYHWGDSGPKVLLLHGWNGRASQFCILINSLLAAGYSVVSFDQPGFGDSEGSHSGLMPIREALLAIVNSDGPFFATIAHSFGWLVAVNSSPEKFCRYLIGIAPPADFSWLLEGFGTYHGFNATAINALKQKVLRKYQIKSLDEISLSDNGPKLTLPGMIIYDNEDEKIPAHQIQLINQHWPLAKIHTTLGLGHTRLLYNKQLAEIIVKNLNDANH